MILADLGAEIVKVENPDGGDETRGMKPPEAGGEAHFYLSVNRTKKSVAIDISTPEGRDLLHALASECDVLVENYRKGVRKSVVEGKSVSVRVALVCRGIFTKKNQTNFILFTIYYRPFL